MSVLHFWFVNALSIQAINTCDTNGCSDICAVVDGDPRCFCSVGFELSQIDEQTCEGVYIFYYHKFYKNNNNYYVFFFI